MERHTTKYLNLLGFLGLLFIIVYINTVAKMSPSILPRIVSFYETVTRSALEPAVHNLAAQYRKGCPEHHFKSVRQLSRAPDIMIIDGFLSNVEAEFLVKAA